MKRLSFLSALLLLVGCQLQPLAVDTTTEVQTYWLSYYPTQCNEKPWGDTLESTTIIQYYQNLGVTIASIEVNAPPSGFFSCAACGCSTGVQVSLQTDEVGKGILLEYGFTAEELVGIAENTEVDEDAEEVTVDTETSEELIETEVTVEVELSAEDAVLQERAELVQSALTDYYSQHGAYPDSLADLTVQLDATSMTYTPIGVTPADYYDLSVEYSTGKIVLNP